MYAFSTIGYLSYTLGQVFHFCIFGNRLIEEVSKRKSILSKREHVKEFAPRGIAFLKVISKFLMSIED